LNVIAFGSRWPFLRPLPPNFEKPANAAAPPVPFARIVKRENSVTRIRIGSRNCTTSCRAGLSDCWSTLTFEPALTMSLISCDVSPSDFGYEAHAAWPARETITMRASWSYSRADWICRWFAALITSLRPTWLPGEAGDRLPSRTKNAIKRTIARPASTPTIGCIAT
jgi:hypothetical protein